MITRFLPILLGLGLAASSPAAPQGLVLLETYEVPNEIWHKTPGELVKDGAGLRGKLMDLAKAGAVKRVDATGSMVIAGQKNLTKAVQFQTYPTEFYAPGGDLIPNALEAGEPGSACEMEPNEGGDLRVSYSLGPLQPEHVPTLAKGSGVNTDRSALPAQAEFRATTGFTIPGGGVQLVAFGPQVPFERASLATLVTFAVTAPGSTYANDSLRPAGNHFTEIVIARGPAGAPDAEAAALRAKLLAAHKPDATLGISGRLGQLVSLESVTFAIYPTEAFESGAGLPVPTALETRNVGDVLTVECHRAEEGKISLRIELEHDFREPELPTVPGRGGELIDKEQRVFQLKVNGTWRVNPYEWTLLKTVPLAPILPREGKDGAAYVFARITSM